MQIPREVLEDLVRYAQKAHLRIGEVTTAADNGYPTNVPAKHLVDLIAPMAALVRNEVATRLRY